MARQHHRQPSIVEQQRGRIHARVIDEENGLRVIGGVLAVRVIDRHARVLIMEDYLPTLGKIDGSIVIVTREGEIPYRGIRGFYKHQHNEFTLLIEQRLPAGENPGEDGEGYGGYEEYGGAPGAGDGDSFAQTLEPEAT